MWYRLDSSFSEHPKPLKSIDIDERVIAYGDGFFTTMAVVNGEVNWLDYHLERIFTGLYALQLSHRNPPPKPIPQGIRTQLNHFAKLLQQGVLKLIICRKTQPIKGYGFVNGETNTWVKLIPSDVPLAEQPNQIIRQPPAHAICLTQQIACLPKPLAGLKLLNTQDKVMASHELWQHQTTDVQVIEGLTQDMMGQWVEGTMSNVFYQLNHEATWYTPPIEHSGVKGVMRQVVLDKLPIEGSIVKERPLETQDLVQIRALFFCNAVRGVMPISNFRLPDGSQYSLELPKIAALCP